MQALDLRLRLQRVYDRLHGGGRGGNTFGFSAEVPGEWMCSPALQVQGISLHARATHARRREVGRPTLPRILKQGDRGLARGTEDKG